MKLYKEYNQKLTFRIHNQSYSKLRKILENNEGYTITSLLRDAVQKHIEKVYKAECQ
jgi:hypothetical protein